MATDAATTDVRRRRLEAADCSTRLVEAGPAEATTAVVFLHGNPGSCDDWEPLVGAVGGIGPRAVAFDLPDFGETIAPAGFEHSAPGYAAFVDAALAALGIERVHLVLHDFGGPIGLTWAATNAERIASITLIDIGILPGYKWHRLARIWRTPVLGEIFMATATKRAFLMLVDRDEPRGLPRPFTERMYEQYDKRTKKAVLALYRATDEPGAPDPALVAALRSADPPALVIWGGGDAYLPSSYAERQREFLPKAEVHVLPHSGHWPFADDPAEVERLLLDFLSRAASSA
jgi:pimeloyl-ACP methyl ester carboxylesterase